MALGKINCLKKAEPRRLLYRNGACIAQIEDWLEWRGENHARIKYLCRCLIEVPIDKRTLIKEARIIAVEFHHASNEVPGYIHHGPLAVRGNVDGVNV